MGWDGLDEYCKLLKPCSSSHPFLAPGQSTKSHLYQSLKAAKTKLPKSFIEILKTDATGKAIFA